MTTDEIQEEMGNLRESIEQWERERSALDAKIDPARRELAHWEGIMIIRRGPEAALAAFGPQDNAVSDSVDGYGAKSTGLRTYIRARAANGVTLSELKAEAVRLGAHPNMAYRLVTRLSAETDPPELERRDGRIFPTAHLKGE
jgi:hypothetical protein